MEQTPLLDVVVPSSADTINGRRVQLFRTPPKKLAKRKKREGFSSEGNSEFFTEIACARTRAGLLYI
jgi:hypothetical protein